MPNPIAKAPRQIFKPHPIYGWTLTPNAQVQVKFRSNVIQNINNDGNRCVPNATHTGDSELLGFYGCSFTYGTALADHETYPSLLQSEFPGIKVTNRGVGGNSTVQALLKFKKDIEDNQVSMAVFGVISDHRYRNTPHPYRMQAFLSLDWYKLGVEHVPHVRLDRKGKLEIVYTAVRQPVINHNFEVFLPDEHMLDIATLSCFKEIQAIADKAGIPVIFALLDQLDPEFNRLMIDTFDETCDVSSPHNSTYTFLPDDLHPNVLANQLFAERLKPMIKNKML